MLISPVATVVTFTDTEIRRRRGVYVPFLPSLEVSLILFDFSFIFGRRVYNSVGRVFLRAHSQVFYIVFLWMGLH